MKLHVSEHGLSWRYAKKAVVVVLPGVASAVTDTIHRRVLAVVHDAREQQELLHAFRFSGAEIFRRSSPTDGRFSYLTAHPDQGALVIVNLYEPIGHWSDWHYAIDAAGELTRCSPAY